MKRAVMFVVFCLASCAVYAADVTLTWPAPTANTDGSTPAAVAGYNVYMAGSDAALTALPNTLNGCKSIAPGATPPATGCYAVSVGNVLTYLYKNLPPGTYFFAVTAWNCQTGQPCTESSQSPHASKVIAAPVVTKTANPPPSLAAK